MHVHDPRRFILIQDFNANFEIIIIDEQNWSLVHCSFLLQIINV